MQNMTKIFIIWTNKHEKRVFNYMSREVAWAIVFLSGKWSQYSPGDVIVVFILGWTKFELLEKI